MLTLQVVLLKKILKKSGFNSKKFLFITIYYEYFNKFNFIGYLQIAIIMI